MNIKKIIRILYQSLFFLVPLVLYPYTSELFEFNKIVLVYILTIAIVFFWLLDGVFKKKLVFKRTLLDIPLMVFLASQIVSTIISIDPRISLFGYYSRFNGGLFSFIAYCLLYWGYVSNLDKKDTLVIIKTILLSTLISSIYGVLEHFGIDKNVWIQDVQNRVFSTFGQPNWLAAWLVAVISVSLSLSLNSRSDGKPGKKETVPGVLYYVLCIKYYVLKNKWLVNFLLSLVFFVTLLFTRSRSGILGFGIAILIYWGASLYIFLKEKDVLKEVLRSFIICVLSFGIIAALVGTPWTPSVFDLQSNKVTNNEQTTPAPALEIGGSSSVEIRKIVWQGAIDVWRNYPLFGSGVETFAFSYYQYRPVAHNLVSEWDFLYNKAHNEYLNFAATTGTFGIISYLFLISCTLLFFKKLGITNSRSQITNEDNFLIFALISGYISILITNFFGFSVVPVNLLFFLFPAMAWAISRKQETGNNKPSFVPPSVTSADKQATSYKDLTQGQKVFSYFLLLMAFCLLLSVSRYWYADVLYNKAVIYGKQGRLIDQNGSITSAIKLSPGEAIYYSELADCYTNIALVYFSQQNGQTAEKFANNAIVSINKAEELSPRNLNIIRNKARIAVSLSPIKPSYVLDAKKTLQKAIELAPTEAKLFYNLALTHYRIGETDTAVDIIKKTIEMKNNYKDARYAYALILSESGDIEGAIQQLNYILENIDPNSSDAKKLLDELNASENQLQIE